MSIYGLTLHFVGILGQAILKNEFGFKKNGLTNSCGAVFLLKAWFGQDD
jgi:hypothetical protein